MLTVIVNDIDNCSVSDMFSQAFQTSNEIGSSGIEIESNSVFILQCDFIIGNEQTDLSTWQRACDQDSNWLQIVKVRAYYREGCILVMTSHGLFLLTCSASSFSCDSSSDIKTWKCCHSLHIESEVSVQSIILIHIIHSLSKPMNCTNILFEATVRSIYNIPIHRLQVPPALYAKPSSVPAQHSLSLSAGTRLPEQAVSL